MKRIEQIRFEFVDLLPAKLEEGVLCISTEHCAVVHSCLSGCGERVVNGLNPTQWSLTYDGETVSLSPSIGNGTLPCNTHYWIRRNRVDWVAPLTARQTRKSQLADERALTAHYKTPTTSRATPRKQKRGCRLLKRLLGRARDV